MTRIFGSPGGGPHPAPKPKLIPKKFFITLMPNLELIYNETNY